MVEPVRISRQLGSIRYRHTWITEHGEAPTVQEIAQQVGLRSPPSVHYQLRQIEEKGAIVRRPGQARGIRLARHVPLRRRLSR